MSIVSTVKTVVQTVKNLDEARKIYENGLSLVCVGETRTSAHEIGELWGISEGNFRVARFAREGEISVVSIWLKIRMQFRRCATKIERLISAL